MVKIYNEYYLKEFGQFFQPLVEQIIQQTVNKKIQINLDNLINILSNE